MDNEEQYKIPDWNEEDAKDMMPSADDAWSSMEQLLDKEMPITTDANTPKGNGGVDIGKWLIGLAAVTLVSVLFLMLQRSDTSTDKKVENQSNHKSAKNNTDEQVINTDEKNKEDERITQSKNDKNQPTTINTKADNKDIISKQQQQSQDKEQVKDADHSAIAKTNSTPLKKDNDLKIEGQQNATKNNQGKKFGLNKRTDKGIVAPDKPVGNLSDKAKLKKEKANGVDLKPKNEQNKNIIVKPTTDKPLKESIDKTTGSNNNSGQPVSDKNTIINNQTANAGDNNPDSIQKIRTENNLASAQQNDSSHIEKNLSDVSGDNTIIDSAEIARERKKFTNPFNAVIASNSNEHPLTSNEMKPFKTKNRDLKSNTKIKAPSKNLLQNGGKAEWLYGLQINPSLPVQNSGYYTTSSDGSKSSLINHFFPGAYLGIRPIGKNKKPSRSQFMLDVNPFYSETMPGTLFLQKADSTREILDSGFVKITRNNAQSSFVKISAVNAGISWQYFINSHFTAGISLRGNFVTGALVNNVSSSLSLLNINGFDSVVNRTSSDSLYKATTADRSLLRSSQLWLMPEFVYHTNAWQFGLRGGLPLNSLNKSPLATNNFPFQAQLFIRFNLGYKKR